ncbi:hypothetical protein KEM55_005124 [Ascosphaera atra]|nr:hypothetical protein KEM55_005124 [Ascosphaera atra]
MSNLRIPGSSPMGSRATAADLRERPPTTEQQEESGLRPAETYGFLDSGTSNDGSDIDPRPADPNASLPLLPDTGTSYHVSDAENSPGFPALQTGHETGFVTPKDLHLNPDPLMDPVQKLYRPKPEITLSEAMEGVTPEAGSRPIDAPESHFEGLNLGEQEFALALPMDSRVRDDYETILRTERPSIREFLQQTSSDEDR